jgi:hypothetical protein
MRNRSIGVTALAASTILVAIYGQYAAIFLLTTGSVSTPFGSFAGAASLVTGATFMGIIVAAYVVGFGLWTRRSWSWNGAIVVYAAFVVANIVFSILATNFVSAVLPTIGAIAAVAYLQRPAVRAEITGEAVLAAPQVAIAEAVGVAGHAH